jgi:hypothetical protein
MYASQRVAQRAARSDAQIMADANRRAIQRVAQIAMDANWRATQRAVRNDVQIAADVK